MSELSDALDEIIDDEDIYEWPDVVIDGEETVDGDDIGLDEI